MCKHFPVHGVRVFGQRLTYLRCIETRSRLLFILNAVLLRHYEGDFIMQSWSRCKGSYRMAFIVMDFLL